MNKNIIILRAILSNIFFKFDSIFYRNEYLKIVCYHGIKKSNNRYDVSLKDFEKQIKNFSKNYIFAHPLDLDRIAKKNYKYKSVLITFDDGFDNFLSCVPILDKYSIKPLLFVLSDRKNVNRKELANNSKLLNKKQIKSLLGKGYVIGSHGATHADFSNLQDKQILKEIFESKKKLESEFGIAIKHFAYPKGAYNNKIIESTKKAGYKYAFSIEPGSVNSHSDKFALPRTIIDNTHLSFEIPSLITQSWLDFRKYTNRFKLWELLIK